MGHVKNELVNEGRGTHERFDYVPFSDKEVLSTLICNRISVDVAQKEKVYPENVLSSNGGMIFNESILCTYISLDQLIESAPLSKKQRAIIQLLMRGYTIQDIADTTNNSQSNISHIFSRALNTLVKTYEDRRISVLTGEAKLKPKD